MRLLRNPDRFRSRKRKQMASILQKNQDNLFSLLATLCRASGRFVLVFLASFLLSTYEFGIFNIFISIYFFSRLFSENSLNLPFIKFTTDGESDPAVVSFQIILLKIFYALAVSLVVFLGADLIVEYSGLERKRLLLLLPFLLLALTSYMFVGQVLISQVRMRSLFIYELLNTLMFCVILAVFFFMEAGFSTEKLISIFLLSMCCSALIGLVVFRRYIDICPGFNKEIIWKIFHYSRFTILSGISSLVILKADILMLGFFCSPADVGIYGMALFVNEAVNVIFDSVLRICLPKASALSGAGEKKEVRKLFNQSVKNIYIGIIPIIAIIAAAAPAVIRLIYKGRYDGSISLVYIFLVVSLVKPVGYVAGVILGATGHIQLDNRICWIAALLNVILNYLLIPRYGVTGAGFASLFSFVGLTLLYYVAVCRTVFYTTQ